MKFFIQGLAYSFIMVILVFAVVFIPLFFVFAQNDDISYGVVIDKQYTPARTQIIHAGKSMIPTSRSERWSIDVAGVNRSGDSVLSTWSVDQDFYNMVNCGDYVQRDPDTMLIEIVGE